jgi:hypothetical protein
MSRSSFALAAALALAAAAPAPARADDAAAVRANTVSLDPLLGVIGFSGRNAGEWAVSYERRVAPRHAVLVEQATVHVHKDPWHLTTFGLGAGYRYYLRPSASAPFVGILGGGKLGTGRFGEGPDNKLTARAVFVTAHAGWRHTWPSGLTVAARLGAGWASYAINDDAPMGAADVKDDRLSPLPIEIDSELSLGYAF